MTLMTTKTKSILFLRNIDNKDAIETEMDRIIMKFYADIATLQHEIYFDKYVQEVKDNE